MTATLWLGSAAALLRVLPGLLNSWLGNLALPDWIAPMLGSAFGLSGPLALAALLCFTLNLWRVLRGEPRAQSHRSPDGQAIADSV